MSINDLVILIPLLFFCIFFVMSKTVWIREMVGRESYSHGLFSPWLHRAFIISWLLRVLGVVVVNQFYGRNIGRKLKLALRFSWKWESHAKKSILKMFVSTAYEFWKLITSSRISSSCLFMKSLICVGGWKIEINLFLNKSAFFSAIKFISLFHSDA